MPSLNAGELQWLGEQIFRNECNSQPACLTSWNAGEEFPSLGIGHFIWYQRGQQGIFQETFPLLLARLERSSVALPEWLRGDADQPWPSRDAFLAEQDAPRMRELRQLLLDTKAIQTDLIVERFQRVVDEGFPQLPADDNDLLRQKLRTVANASPPYGLYALIDYVHFKGEGTSASERYQGEGWGLIQVLQGMPASSSTPLEDFVASARQVLAQRVLNAPAERREDRWLQGWHNRVSTYLPPQP